MAEYIERKYLLELYRMDDPILNENGHVPLPVIRQNIIDIPAADVAPVRHGRWIDKSLIKSFKHTNIPVVECSACGIDFCDIINNHYFMYKYCPNCGAKMDGGVDDACL